MISQVFQCLRGGVKTSKLYIWTSTDTEWLLRDFSALRWVSSILNVCVVSQVSQCLRGGVKTSKKKHLFNTDHRLFSFKYILAERVRMRVTDLDFVQRKYVVPRLLTASICMDFKVSQCLCGFRGFFRACVGSEVSQCLCGFRGFLWSHETGR